MADDVAEAVEDLPKPLPETKRARTPHERRIRYRASLTMSRFHQSKARVRGLKGPIGAGKSVACVNELLRLSVHQAPDAKGVRRTRFAIIRNTYGELRSTTIRTWQEWIPEDICPIVYDSPIRGLLRFPLPDKTSVECEVLFMALDKAKDVKKLLSLELTAAWINEAREIPWALVLATRSRLGRYPPKNVSPITQVSLLLDTNPPDTDHWWYKVAEERAEPTTGEIDPEIGSPEAFEFFSQPPALMKHGNRYLPNPDAENVQHHNLGYSYWLDQVSGATAEWIKVYLLGQYGFVLDGKLVYPEYRDDVHCRDVQPDPNLPLIGAYDFGLTPAFVLGQLTMRGTLVILDEWQATDMGLEQFVDNVVIPQLAIHYPQWPHTTGILCGADPAGNDPSQADELSCYDVLKDRGFQLGITATMSNAFGPRRAAVSRFLTRMDGGKPGFAMSPKCRMLRKGFQGGYHYRRMQIAGKVMYRDVPDKDIFSHCADSLQYLCMLASGGVPRDSRPKDGATSDEASSTRAPRRRHRSILVS